MRMIFIVAALALAAPLTPAITPVATAQDCSGPDCAKPGGSSGGHECERKKEPVTS